jgi:molecular chaperone DnaJ
MMVPKNYYLILGVAPSESPAGIRARYRDLVRTLHPDVAGPQSTSAFQNIAEAYAVLADPLARRRHDTELATWEESPPVQERAESAAPWRWTPVSPSAEPLAVRPSLDAMVERLFRNFTGIGIPNAQRPDGLTFELILTPDEAVRGVQVPIALPRVDSCEECGGIGRVWLFPCASCGGQRVIVTERVVRIQIPPLVRPESVIEVPLHGVGIHNLYLRLHVRIEKTLDGGRLGPLPRPARFRR